MSILIKGMKKPKSCAECRFSGFGGLRNELVVCMFTGANAYMNTVQYLDDCPLVPIPPHGRLIDADVLYAVMAKERKRISKDYGENDEYVQCLTKYAMSMVANAPTIIEAEEGEHGEEKR